MNAEQRRRLSRAFAQAQTTEEDTRIAIADHERELAVADPNFQPRKVAMLREQLAHLRTRLVEAQDRVDELRREVREANLPPDEPPQATAFAAIKARDSKPTVWGTGGDISEVRREWDAPIQPKRNPR